MFKRVCGLSLKSSRCIRDVVKLLSLTFETQQGRIVYLCGEQ